MKHLGKNKGVITRECSRCGGDLGYRHGKQRYCKSCHAEYNRMIRPRYYELSEEQRKRSNARSYAKVYLKRGKITKKPCLICGSGESQMHHPDYDKPLDVIWLCRKHHLEIHRVLNGQSVE